MTYTVFGYIRKEESNLRSICDVILFQSIPELITQIIISYYLNKAYFDIIGQDINISEDKSTISKHECSDEGSWNNSSYSLPVKSTDKKICKWDIKIHTATPWDGCGSLISTGITSTTVNDAAFEDAESEKTYAWGGWNGKLWDSAYGGWKGSYADCLYGSGDTLSVELNLIKGEISFYHNGKNLGVAYKDIHQSDDVDYRLAFSIESSGEIELLGYSESYCL